MRDTRQVEFRISFNADIDLEPANSLRASIAAMLERADLGRIVLLFASDGGSTDQSISLYNWLRGLPVDIHIHAIGHVGSSAFPVFLAGHYRSCAPLARFFLHEYDWSFTEPQTLRRMAEAEQRLRSDIDSARKIIESTTEMPPAMLDALDGRAGPVMIAPEQARGLKIVHEICELDRTGRDGMPVAIWT